MAATWQVSGSLTMCHSYAGKYAEGLDRELNLTAAVKTRAKNWGLVIAACLRNRAPPPASPTIRVCVCVLFFLYVEG